MTVMLCPDASVEGGTSPEEAKPVPVIDNWLIVTVALPLTESVSVLLYAEPTVTFPKSIAFELTVSWLV